MDSAGGGQFGAVFGVKVVQIGLVLEEVSVQVAVGQGFVGHDVVGELFDLQLDALLGQLVADGFQDLGVGGGGGADHQFGGAFGGSFGSGGAAAGEGEGQDSGAEAGEKFMGKTHRKYLLSL